MGGVADGQYGDQTARAVRLFQQANGLNVTGVTNTATWEKLFSEEAIVDEIVAAQQRLWELGFLDGQVDGVWGSQSIKAIKRFQTANNLMETGELDAETQAILFSDDARRNELMDAQRKLIEWGYLTGSATGEMDEATVNAICLFQELHGLNASGELEVETMEALSALDEPYTALSSGSEGEQVEALQKRLIQFGFLDDAADGKYGSKTAAAVRSFQEHLKRQEKTITVNGIASPLTQEYLFSTVYSTYVQDIAPGEENDEVLRMETRLVELGYMDAQADTVYDDYAAQAMQAFCEAEGLAASDVVNRIQINALFAADVSQAHSYVAHDVSLGDSGQAVKQVEEAMRRYGMMTAAVDGEFDQQLRTALERFQSYLDSHNSEYAHAFADPEYLSIYAQELLVQSDFHCYTEDVQPGAGEEITRRLQRRLAALYYLPEYGVDGQCAGATQQAISTFQEKNGLTATGIADEVTQDILFSNEALGCWTPYLLEVRISEQRVYVYQLDENNEYVQIDRFICSTGLGNSTPRGTFLDTGRMYYWHYFEAFDCWAQYSFQIDGDILFHSVLYSEKDTSTLRESSVYALGSKASHGCVRLQVADAQWIFQNCQKGTIIVIR